MALDVWFRDNIQHILNGIAYAANKMAIQFTARGHTDEEALAYREGFIDALQAVGLAVGIGDFTDEEDK